MGSLSSSLIPDLQNYIHNYTHHLQRQPCPVLMEPIMSCTNGSHGYNIISWFEDATKNAGSIQTQTLSQILKQNHGVEYLKKWLGDYNIQHVDDCALEPLFTSVVPLASHADFEPLIQRIADGDTAPLLTQQSITTLSLRYTASLTSSLLW